MIKKLPDDVIKKISAGEVIENPASCVRELVENSLDAGAKNIKIHIKGGGIDYVEVVDDGCGIPKEEIPLAVKRFTTSKISAFEDLKSLKTLGFRGEALYAIAQVSNLTIRSSVNESYENGWECIFEAGTLIKEGPFPHPKGTTVIVKDLFFNLPVRRKFLLSKREEGKKVLNEIINYALWHTDVYFTFVDEEKTVLDLPPGDFAERVMKLIDPDFPENSLFITYEDKYMKITGFIQKPEKIKSSRSPRQITLVNGRGVKNDLIRKVIFKAFDTPVGNPEFIFKIEINPEFVDFNIHPQKKEIKIAPYLRFGEKLFKIVSSKLEEYKNALGESITKPHILAMSSKDDNPPKKTASVLQLEFGEMDHAPRENVKTEQSVPVNVWQAHRSFIFVETMSGVMIIDQHAAHERIIYEKLKKKQFSKQSLLFPILIELSATEKSNFNQYADLFESYGFEFRFLDDNSLVIDKVPSLIKNVNKETIKEIVGSLEAQPDLPSMLDNFLKNIACKSALKFGDSLLKKEISTLIDELFTTENPFHCPHGRPTIYFISLEELNSKFER